jgi:glycosyltransferase involved in cell wall biosynthesis
MLDLVRRSDVAVYPSRAEGFGLPLLESLTLGVPVVTTDAPPMNELVRDGENGRLVGGRFEGRHRHVPLFEVDREALGEAMEALSDPGMVDRLKAGAAAGLEERREGFREGIRAAVRGERR